jgi:hypothetical protein
MKAFNASLLTHTCRQLTIYEQNASLTNSPDDGLSEEQKGDISLTLAAAKTIAFFVKLDETKDAIARLEFGLKSTAEPLTVERLRYALVHLLELMQSELEKRKVFAVDSDKAKYYQDDIWGVNPPFFAHQRNALFSVAKQPEYLFSERSAKAFPSAYMDIVEAGRCLALNRNNAAIYHLMQVAEIGLRTLAWDRRTVVIKWKKEVPLEFAQWGDLIVGIQQKMNLINQWARSKALKDEALRYYKHAIFEVDSFNEIFRKHISHARGELYEPDVAISCWGYVYRFMDALAEHMSEASRMPNVWNNPKKLSIFD